MGAIHSSGPESSVSPEHQSDAASRAVWDLVIIGAGPAGMACAIYAGRARLRTLVLEKMLAGGQVVLNDIIENYPGFPEGIAGPDLGRLMSEHAARFGAEIQNGTVEAIDCSHKPLAIHLAGTDPEAGPRARSLLIATGCSPRKLGVPGERELYGRGVSYCATCDGPLFAGRPVAVVGGGNTATDDALFLANIASKVTVVHRRDQLRADPILQERAFANAKIEFGWSRVATAIVGDQAVEAIRTRHVTTGEETDVPVAGVFIAIGETPQVGFVPDHIRRDEGGYIVTDADFQTSAEGVFAAGDVRAGAYRQIAVAIGEGVLAYRSIRNYLEGQS